MKHTTLEALLNMLPGVRVDKVGNITRDNDEVVDILVDGVEIFGQARRSVALRNIQAYAIEEIWFYKKDGSASVLLDHEMGDDVKVMDIRLKKEYNTGTPVDIKAGIGTGDGVQYKGSLLGLYNNEDTRVFVYGSADNLNEGEMSNNYSLFSGESAPDGTLTNYSGGASLLKYLDKSKLSYVITSAGVSEDDLDCFQITSTKVFLPGRDIIVQGTGFSSSENLKANTNTRLHIEDEKAFHDAWLDFTYSSYSKAGQNNVSFVNRNNTTSTLQHLSDIFNRNHLLKAGYDGGLRLQRGMLRWGGELQYANTTNKDNTFYSFAHPVQNFGTKYRYNFWNAPMQNAKGALTFGYETGNLGIIDRIQAHYLYDCTWESVDSTLQTLNGTALLRDLLNSYTSKVLTHRHNLLFQSKANFEPVLGIPLSATLLVPVRFVSREMDYIRLRNNNYLRNDILCEPSLEIEYGGSHNFKFNADLVSTVPPMLFCTPFRNTSDPMHIHMGNTELRNSHDLLLKLTHERTTSSSAFYKSSIEYRYTENAIGTNAHFNEQTGVFTSMPVNVDGNWGLTGDFWVNTPLDGKGGRFALENHLYATYAHDIDLSSQEGVNYTDESTTHTGIIANDLVFTFRPSKEWDLRAIVSGMWMHCESNIPDFIPINTWDLYYGLRAQGELPWEIFIGSTLMVNTTRGYHEEGLNGDCLLWNAEISRSFLNDRLIVSLKGFDILAQLSNEYHTITPISITEVSSNVAPRSFLLSFAWRM